jgi:hypothetical protein
VVELSVRVKESAGGETRSRIIAETYCCKRDVANGPCRTRAQSVESLLHLSPVNYHLSFEIDGDDFMLPEAGVKNSKPTAVGMKGDVNREHPKPPRIACPFAISSAFRKKE